LFIEERDRKEPKQGTKKEVKVPGENSPIENKTTLDGDARPLFFPSFSQTSNLNKTELLPTTTRSGANSADASQAPVAASQRGNPRGRPCMRESSEVLRRERERVSSFVSLSPTSEKKNPESKKKNRKQTKKKKTKKKKKNPETKKKTKN